MRETGMNLLAELQTGRGLLTAADRSYAGRAALSGALLDCIALSRTRGRKLRPKQVHFVARFRGLSVDDGRDLIDGMARWRG